MLQPFVGSDSHFVHLSYWADSSRSLSINRKGEEGSRCPNNEHKRELVSLLSGHTLTTLVYIDSVYNMQDVDTSHSPALKRRRIVRVRPTRRACPALEPWLEPHELEPRFFVDWNRLRRWNL